ncbi:MAG: ScyD/ScyE family protein [Brasilonema angustatum HA4187-MV1]|jgi:hypothetical protein|nr:ScyD/ScyE family protein [Brasilonema angustatum HA4187-MV1]
MKFKSFALLFSVCVTATCGTQAARAASLSVVADGLDNARGISFAPDGSIYVTQSGKGGDGNGGVNCIPSPSAQYIPLCSGNTGAVTKITADGQKVPLLTNLPSIALTPSGEQAAGPADIKFDSKGDAYLLYGLAGDPNSRDTKLASPLLGQLYKVDLNTGSLTSLADFASYEAKNNPDGTDLISNPYAFAIKGDTAYVVDGGGNSIYSVGLDGSGIKNVAAIPQKIISLSTDQFPTLPEGTTDPTGGAPLPPGYTRASNGLPVSNQSVPTGIAVAPDGSLTLSEYTYFPYPEKEARILKVDPDTLQTQVLADGFTQLTGVTYDSDGNLYALQHINQSEWKAIQQGGVITGDISGSVIEIAKDGTRKTIWSGDGLEAASELTFGPDGDLYISNRARLAGTSQVIKIDPRSSGGATKVPEPASVIGLLLATAVGVKAMKRKRQEELLDKVETI